ncbi:D-alanine--D-alanine ligase [Algimonas porphyrae]|uniref:D-alanine--D-alanine ligase n=1 Tax=Algimonas porphyrae TaxID=1128113 RepID=A0ABQ5UXX6_9PROT|nr:D-alanine--D-alanine ligase [Algimonas porphyrae]GLQ20071.1 D-alanine--D-alanine ligase [Algimonas porphyrae]
MKVAVLMGGISAERDVSLVSGRACAEALRREGFDVMEVDAHPDRIEAELTAISPDVVFNALHGDWGEDGEVQGILEQMRLPYTHSSVAASRAAMNKDWAKAVFALHGITVPIGQTASRTLIAQGGVLPVPYVVKPNGSGSSASVYLVHEESKALLDTMGRDEGLGDAPVIEPFIAGRELTVSVLGGKAVCVTEIVPEGDWYDYDAKYADGGSRHILNPPLPDIVTRMAMDNAEIAHRALHCSGVTRADYRLDDRNWDENPSESDVVNGLVMLELNTQPGMTPTSLVPEQCQHVGMSFSKLCRWIVEDASWPRKGQRNPPS